MTPLEQKCLNTAISQIKNAWNKKRANEIYTAWKVFHTNKLFLSAVTEKQKEFKQKGI
jgi:hypothetical protein